MTTTPPDGVSIRRAERADLLDVFRIEQASFPEPWPFDAFERFLGEPGFLVAVGDPADAPKGFESADEGVCGYVVSDVELELGRQVGHVKDLAVAAHCRGRGIGSRLLERALAVVAGSGARQAKLEVRVDNRPARALYEDYGFEADHVIENYYDDGQDALLLVADLSDRFGG